MSDIDDGNGPIDDVNGDIDIKELDDDVSILYKFARFFETPVRYILVLSPEDLRAVRGDTEDLHTVRGKVYMKLSELVQDLIEDDLSLTDLRDTIQSLDLGQQIQSYDIVMFYVFIQNSLDADKNKEKVLFEVNEVFKEDADDVDKPNRFSSIESLLSNNESFVRSFNVQLQSDLKILENILRAQDALEEIKDYMPLSPMNVTLRERVYHPTFKQGGPSVDPSEGPSVGPSVTYEDGIDIFNNCVPTLYIPFIQYNDATRQYFKVREDPSFPADTAVQIGTEAHTIYLTIWKGTGHAKESYIRVSYTLEGKKSVYRGIHATIVRNSITLTVQVSDKFDIIEEVSKVFPTLSLGVGVEKKVRAEYYIYNTWIDEVTLINVILNDPEDIMNTYLYIDERGKKSYATKQYLRIHFRNLARLGYEQTDSKEADEESAATIIMNQHRTDTQILLPTSVDGSSNKSGEYTLEKDMPYTQVILTADNTEQIRHFILIYQRLLRLHELYSKGIQNAFTSYIPELKDNKVQEDIRLIHIRTTNPLVDISILPIVPEFTTRIDKLQYYAPSIFVTGYSRVCQPKQQPDIILTDQEEQEWRNRKFYDPKTKTYKNRQILYFPPPHHPHHMGKPFRFVCPTDERPYPGVRANTSGENKDIYPYVPSCYETDQMSEGLYSDYRLYYFKENKVRKSEKSSTILSTNKTVDKDRLGYIPSFAKTILEQYSNEYVYMRYGVIKGPNSLIHCVMKGLAGNDPTEKYKTVQDRDLESYVSDIRSDMATSIFPELLKQEMYDSSLETIKENLGKPNVFLDPRLYYRAVEEYFGVNIYTITMDGLEIPRYKAFHSHMKRRRKTIVIFKTFGAPSENLQEPVCELIVGQSKTRMLFSYPLDMNDIFYSMLSIHTNISWSINGDLVGRQDVFSRVDPYSMLKNTPITQRVDDYGKCRGFQSAISRDTLVTILTLPTQPENHPSFTDEQITWTEADKVLDIFGEPVGYTVTTSGTSGTSATGGYWYSFGDVVYAFCIPVKNNKLSLDVGPSHPFLIRTGAVSESMVNTEKVLNVFLQLIRWAFLLLQNQQPVMPNREIRFVPVDQFISQYISVDPSVGGYDFSKVPYRLPVDLTIEEGIKEMSTFVPTMFRGNRIRIYSERLRDKLRQYMVRYVHDWFILGSSKESPTYVNRIAVPNHIEDLYRDPSDFIQRQGVHVFVNQRDLYSWFHTLTRTPEQSIMVRTKLDISYGLNDEPYLFQDSDGKLYIIQNIRLGDFTRASAVAISWKRRHVNMGAVALPWPFDSPPYVIYGIDRAGSLALLEDHTDGSEDYLQLLNYTAGQTVIAPGTDKKVPVETYAAMLPLL